MDRLFTSESVTEGHPDKVCDRIADTILDTILAQDSTARVACEVCATTGLVLIMGEITTTAHFDAEAIARSVIADIGYIDNSTGFSADSVRVQVELKKQSPDIAQGVDRAYTTREERYERSGAGDQGMMFGYACTETEELMPLPITLAHRLARRLAEVRHNGEVPYLLPDGKTQVTVMYRDDVPVYVDTIVISTQNDGKTPYEKLVTDLMSHVIIPSIPAELRTERTKLFINPTGAFVIGGPEGDSGLTGRKIIVDTYGGYCTHGGGAFSGKDPSKVDRSASYFARFVAKNIVAAGLAKRARVDVSYAIGVAKPVSVYVETFGTGIAPDMVLAHAVQQVFDFRPAAIIDRLGLISGSVKYAEHCNYGHFGGTDVPWEQIIDTTEQDKLKAYALNA